MDGFATGLEMRNIAAQFSCVPHRNTQFVPNSLLCLTASSILESTP